jgi:hypothetical protein
MLAAPFARGFFVGDYMGLAAKPGVGQDHAGNANNQEDGNGGFVPLFVMSNCANNRCAAVGTSDGTPAGPDSTDAYTSSRTT